MCHVVMMVMAMSQRSHARILAKSASEVNEIGSKQSIRLNAALGRTKKNTSKTPKPRAKS
jgi:hypothetical protein